MDVTEVLFTRLGYPARFDWNDITLEVMAVLGMRCSCCSFWCRHRKSGSNDIWAIKGGYEFSVADLFL